MATVENEGPMEVVDIEDEQPSLKRPLTPPANDESPPNKRPLPDDEVDGEVEGDEVNGPEEDDDITAEATPPSSEPAASAQDHDELLPKDLPKIYNLFATCVSIFYIFVLYGCYY